MALPSRRFGAGDPDVLLVFFSSFLFVVMLVLIITIPIQLHAVNLEMPVGVPPSNVEPQKVQIDIDEKSVVYWQGLPVNASQLDADMTQIAQQPVPPDIHIRPNKDCQYAVFANVLATTKRKGLNKVAVIGSEQFVRWA